MAERDWTAPESLGELEAMHVAAEEAYQLQQRAEDDPLYHPDCKKFLREEYRIAKAKLDSAVVVALPQLINGLRVFQEAVVMQ